MQTQIIPLYKVKLALGMANDLIKMKRGKNPIFKYAENCKKFMYALSTTIK